MCVSVLQGDIKPHISHCAPFSLHTYQHSLEELYDRQKGYLIKWLFLYFLNGVFTKSFTFLNDYVILVESFKTFSFFRLSNPFPMACGPIGHHIMDTQMSPQCGAGWHMLKVVPEVLCRAVCSAQVLMQAPIPPHTAPLGWRPPEVCLWWLLILQWLLSLIKKREP